MEIGFWEILLIVIVAGMVFGVGKLPEIGKQLGRGVRDFKKYSAVDGRKPATTETKPAAPAAIVPPEIEAAKIAAPDKFSKN